MEALVAAVESGADAVYLAGNKFGARAYASNFTDNQMREAIEFAHLRNVKVHVAVNTLVGDSEMQEMQVYLRFLYDSNVDALLVQDLGILSFIHDTLPDMAIHASTQMTVHNLAGVEMLAELGCSRVVLSRELSLSDIKYICAHTDIEVEIFAHGALCVCFSGQCLFSSMIGGRSGNRGRCAQPCRLPYTLLDENGNDVLDANAGKYLLSPRDLNTLDILGELAASGVASLKLEGRMKRPEYVAVAVQAYRHAIDRLYSPAQDYFLQDKKRLAQIFNRSFTTSYLQGNSGKDMMSDRRPNNRGGLVGRVQSYDFRTKLVVLKLSEMLHQDDQLDFWVKIGGRVTAVVKQLFVNGKEVSSASAGEIVSFIVPGVVHIHDRAFKVFDSVLMAEAKEFFRKGNIIRRVSVDAVFKAINGQKAELVMSTQDGEQVRIYSSFVPEKAINHPLTKEIVYQHLARLGTSIFVLATAEIELQTTIMFPVSELNSMRRQAVDSLYKQRLEKYQKPSLKIHATCEKSNGIIAGNGMYDTKASLLVSVYTMEQARAALSGGADWVLFGGESYNGSNIKISEYEEACSLARAKGRKISFNTPRILLEQEMKDFQSYLEAYNEMQPDEINVHNLGMFYLASHCMELPIHIDASLNVYNAKTVAFWYLQGAVSITLSPELNLEQIKLLGKCRQLPLEVVVAGRQELMVSRYCPLGSFLGNVQSGKCQAGACQRGSYSLQDRKKEKFPLCFDQFCRTHLLNAKILSMLPYTRELLHAGIYRLRIDGKNMLPSELKQVVAMYKKSLVSTGKNQKDSEEQWKALEGAGITRGHFFRGVL